jgi:hypothetical protein
MESRRLVRSKSVLDEDVTRLQQDFAIIVQKIADQASDTPQSSPHANMTQPESFGFIGSSSSSALLGFSSPPSASSFVSGLRGIAEHDRRQSINSLGSPPLSRISLAPPIPTSNLTHSAGTEKVTILEGILSKITEYDRLILHKTNPIKDSAGSFPVRRKSLRGELFSLPTHFQLVDRLLDFYHQSQRVVVVRDGNQQPNKSVMPATPPIKTRGDDVRCNNIK